MNLAERSVAGARTSDVLLRAAVGCALILGLTGCHRSSRAVAPMQRRESSPYTLMQMNLCLSGIAGCYRRVHYPAGVDDAVALIREANPNAVTLNETCRGDVAVIARRTGYHLQFAQVLYHGAPLPCIDPGGRGPFGNAVLTKAPIESTESQAFKTQAGPERRQWLCVTTRASVDVCTTHAPKTFWTQTDSSAHQDPGRQQIFGSSAFRLPSVEAVPARHTDHDVLLLHARLSAQP